MAEPLPPVRYRPDLEHADGEEARTIEELARLFEGMARTVAGHEQHAHRAVHAKGHALLRARLRVLDALPPDFSHGLFAYPANYPALVRMSSPPAEQLPDTVSTPRALAIKVSGVDGPRVDGGGEQHSQDFLMVNGPTFSSPGLDGFLRAARLLAATTERMPRTKEVISATLRGVEAVLEAAGADGTRLRGLGGEPQHHPLGETYFTQVPFLLGPYMAKFSLEPASPALVALRGQPLEPDEDAQREAICTFFNHLDAPVEWILRAQLCRDLERMPIEDASVEWDEADSPWQPVARLSVPSQLAWDSSVSPHAEDALAFSPWHALAAHRPLGALNRARRVVMATSREFRSRFNHCPLREPRADEGWNASA
ncbi:catalase family protein [Pseudoxanthomonas daejeonensis]|uniref:catalase family protein n=1 Tax=Pseudoxanthomonas daejeonensis TaxID=266062 RepID=UPI001F547610|nr:catalase family protein [Pseudoxanthomonas daejeonensis]UNK56295.1 catalase family protein [Pseudoxanthomonas daejeonensis]